MDYSTYVDGHGIEWTPFEKELVLFIDNLLELHKKRGSPSQVVSESDWHTLEYILKGFETLYPQLSHDFYKNMREWRNLSTAHGVSREKGGALIQHKLEIPEKVYNMIKIVFPQQKWDKKFSEKFARRFSSLTGSYTL